MLDIALHDLHGRIGRETQAHKIHTTMLAV